jgi:hypothetical protein
MPGRPAGGLPGSDLEFMRAQQFAAQLGEVSSTQE